MCHLLLETIPPPLALPSHLSQPPVQTAAASLFDTCLRRRNARIAVKLATCFGLTCQSDGNLLPCPSFLHLLQSSDAEWHHVFRTVLSHTLCRTILYARLRKLGNFQCLTS